MSARLISPRQVNLQHISDVNIWRINFDLQEKPADGSKATFTIQLAGAETTAGNTDDASGANPNFNVSIVFRAMSRWIGYLSILDLDIC